MNSLSNCVEFLRLIHSSWNTDTSLRSNISILKQKIINAQNSISDFEVSARSSERITFSRDGFIQRQKVVFVLQRIKELLNEIVMRIPLLNLHADEGHVRIVDTIVSDMFVKLKNQIDEISNISEKKPRDATTFLTRVSHSWKKFLFPRWTGWEL